MSVSAGGGATLRIRRAVGWSITMISSRLRRCQSRTCWRIMPWPKAFMTRRGPSLHRDSPVRQHGPTGGWSGESGVHESRLLRLWLAASRPDARRPHVPLPESGATGWWFGARPRSQRVAEYSGAWQGAAQSGEPNATNGIGMTMPAFGQEAPAFTPGESSRSLFSSRVSSERGGDECRQGR